MIAMCHSKPGYKTSKLLKAGIIISPQPTPYNTGLKIKVTKNGIEVKGSKDKTYTPKECFEQIEIITDYYYQKLIEL